MLVFCSNPQCGRFKNGYEAEPRDAFCPGCGYLRQSTPEEIAADSAKEDFRRALKRGSEDLEAGRVKFFEDEE